MFACLNIRSRPAVALGLALAGVILLGSDVLAQGDGRGARSPQYPWNAPGYRGYNETARPTQPPPGVATRAPQKYTITVTILPQKVEGAEPNIARIMAHLPEDAQVWFQDQPTRSTGMLRHYESPPLVPGKHYHYTARVVWPENGEWVGQTTKIAVQAGEIHCLYLTRAADEARIAANLAKLSPEDRKLAEAQKVCAVQRDNRLGAMGVPVKVMIHGQPVFLCCQGCEETALADPDKTLAVARELRAKNEARPRK
jgi:uncharacterized protein (TIGR03000 family)